MVQQVIAEDVETPQPDPQNSSPLTQQDEKGNERRYQREPNPSSKHPRQCLEKGARMPLRP